MRAENLGRTARLRLYSVAELIALPQPSWLIDQLITEGALVGLYGPPGEGKTFLALDWALSIAHGERWLETAVLQGPVLYIAAEGGRSIGKRVAAWMQSRGVETVGTAFFLLESLQLRNLADVGRLTTALEELEITPRLIVADTLARCFVGGEENSAKDMGDFVEGLEWIRRTTGAAVMVLHHTAKPRNKKRGNHVERGSNALRAAADVMIEVSRGDDGTITVINTKQKDAEEFANIRLRLQEVEVTPRSGNATTSCVFVSARSANLDSQPSLAPELRRTLAALPDGEVTRKRWSEVAELAERTLDHHREQLVNGGYVRAVKRGIYEITAKGVAARRTAATATHLQSADRGRMPAHAAATATTPLGVAVAAGSAGEGMHLGGLDPAVTSDDTSRLGTAETRSTTAVDTSNVSGHENGGHQ